MPQVTTEELRAIFSGDATSYQNAVDKVTKSNSKLLESDNKVKNQLDGLAKELMMVDNPAQALTTTISRLSEVFNVGLATSIGVVAIDAFARDMARARDEAEKFGKVFDEISAIRPDSQTMSSKELGDNLEAARKAANALGDEANRLEEKFSGIGGTLRSIVSPGDATRFAGGEVQSLLQEQYLLTQQQDAALGAMVEKENERVNLLRTQRQEGAAAMQIAEMQLRHAQEMAQVQDRLGSEMAEATAARHAEESAALEKAIQTRRETLDLEQKILGFKQTGEQSEIRAAQAKLAAARKEFMQTPPATEESKAAGNKINAARAELEAAARAYSLTQSNAILQSKIANLRGSEDDKRIRALEMERQFLEWKKQNVARPDDIRGIQAEMDRNRAALETAREEKRMREIQSQSMVVDSEKGFGPTEELKAAKAKADIAWQLVDAAKAKSNYDEQEYFRLVASAKEIDKQVTELRVRNQIDEVHNSLMEQELKIQASVKTEHDKRVAVTKAQIAATQNEISALKSLNAELARAAQLKLQGLQNEQRQQQLNLFGMTPAQRRQFTRDQRNEQRRNQKAEEKLQANDGLFDVQRDASGRVISGREKPGGPRVQRQPEDEFKRAFDPAEKANREKDRDKDRVNADEAFKEKFMSGKQRAASAEERKNKREAEAKERQGKEAGKASDPIVKELKVIETKLDNLALT